MPSCKVVKPWGYSPHGFDNKNAEVGDVLDDLSHDLMMAGVGTGHLEILDGSKQAARPDNKMLDASPENKSGKRNKK